MANNISELWKNAGISAKTGFSIGVIAIVAALGYAAVSVLRSEYQVMFSDLDPQDAASIVAELERWKIPYALGADATSVSVDKDKMHATRLKLMDKGVQLRGGVGLEIFNNTDFGMTEFAQKINYQRALQGELARTIMALDEVKFARVHLVLPESGLFKKSSSVPKASVTVTMKEGLALRTEQVVGIQRLVAASVPEIAAPAVTILDQRGVPLTRKADTEKDESASFSTVKQEIEAYLTKKVVAVLDKTFGPGQAIVSVDATVNHDQTKITQEDVIPMSRRGSEAMGAIVRRRTTVQGAPSELTNTGSMEAATQNGSSTMEVEYQSGRRVEQIISQPGSLRRLSVAVMLPRSFDKEKLEEIRQVLGMTVGLNPARGDEIAISALDQFAAGKAEAPVSLGGTKPSLTPEAPASSEAGVAGVNTKGAPVTSQVPVTRFWNRSGAQWIVLIVLSVSALLVALWYRGRGRTLTSAERENMLKRTRQWVRGEAAVLNRGENP